MICVCLSLSACGGSAYGIRIVETLEKQQYSLAFRDNDPLYFYVTGGIKVLAAKGSIAELNAKWFGGKGPTFEQDSTALDEIGMPEPGKTLIIGADGNSFPLAYFSGNTVFGYDIELASMLCEYFQWNLKIQVIEKENVYNELASGNIDVAWGGVALSEEELDEGQYTQFGPYISNDIVIAARANSTIWNAARLRGKTLAMPSTPEAMGILESNKRIMRKLGDVLRVVGGTIESFDYLYQGKCDAILTDSTAVTYYNCH